MICALPFLMLVPPLPGVPLSVEDIVCRVAENQQRSLTARNSYVYDMNVFVRMKRANGKVAREETRDYVVVPGPRGAKRSLVSLEGRIFEGKTEIPYTNARYKHKGTDIDADITDSFAREIMWRRRSMGIYLDWFPLQKENAPRYTFRLEGEERYRGYDVYKLSYTKLRDDEHDACWSGEALIEKREFQPVLITSSWSCKIPRAVTLMLGISLSQMGSKITYERFEKDLWFPSVSGGELKVRVLFLYARTIAFSAKNSNFRKTAVETNIAYETEENGEASVPLELLHHLTDALIAWGPAGILLLAILDSSGVPVAGVFDALLILLAVQRPSVAWLCAGLAVAGSTVGSMILFWMAQKGGRRFMDKAAPEGRAARFRDWFHRYGLITVFVPALVPIPMPLKLFVISAGVLGTSTLQFASVLFAARILRYFGEAWLGIRVGRDSPKFLASHAWHFIGGAVALFAVLYCFILVKQRRAPLI